MDAVVAFLIVCVVLGLGGWVMYVGINAWTCHVIHEAFCVCERCRTEAIEREVKARRWSKQRDEIRRAVDEVERVTRPHGR